MDLALKQETILDRGIIYSWGQSNRRVGVMSRSKAAFRQLSVESIGQVGRTWRPCDKSSDISETTDGYDATVRVVRLLLDGLVKRLESRHTGTGAFAFVPCL